MEAYAKITTSFCHRFIRTIQGDIEVGDFGVYYSIDNTGYITQTVKGMVEALKIEKGSKIATIRIPESIFPVDVIIDPGKLDLTIVPSNFWRDRK